jgi:PST family polysaccharide transporter
MSEYHDRAKRAVGLLMGRQLLLQILTFSGGVVLARTLGPGPFGLYAICSVLVGVFALVGDFGLAPSFVQRKAELTPLDLQVGFTLQQALTTIIVVALVSAAPLLGRCLYPDQPDVVWLIRALSLNLYLAGWRTMSALQLERELKFDRLAKIEVLEVLVFQVLAVGLSLLGCGTWSLIAASLAQGVLGTTLIYMAAPWTVRLRWDAAIIRQLLRYGLPFQLQTALNAAGGWIAPLVIGRQVGPVGVGYLTWASSNGRKPLMVTDNIMRVAFPHFSRLQDDRAEVERLVIRYLTFSLVPAGLWFAGLFACCPSAVRLVYAEKWVPATPALLLYAAVLPLDMLSWIVAVTLNGLGEVGASTAMVTARTVSNIGLTIGLIVVLPVSAAIVAVPIAYILASLATVPWLLIKIRPGAMGRVLGALAWIAIPVAAGVAVGWITYDLAEHRVPPVFHVGLAGGGASLAFAAGALLAAPVWLRALVADQWCRWRNSRSASKPVVAV